MLTLPECSGNHFPTFLAPPASACAGGSRPCALRIQQAISEACVRAGGASGKGNCQQAPNVSPGTGNTKCGEAALLPQRALTAQVALAHFCWRLNIPSIPRVQLTKFLVTRARLEAAGAGLAPPVIELVG